MMSDREPRDLQLRARIQEITEQSLRECEVDECGFWEIHVQVKRELGEHEKVKIRELTMGIVRELLSDPRVLAGDLERNVNRMEFIDWKMTREETIARIERAWDALDEDPQPGDVVWFTVIPDEQE